LALLRRVFREALAFQFVRLHQRALEDLYIRTVLYNQALLLHHLYHLFQAVQIPPLLLRVQLDQL
jgi:hypothetical protein